MYYKLRDVSTLRSIQTFFNNCSILITGVDISYIQGLLNFGKVKVIDYMIEYSFEEQVMNSWKVNLLTQVIVGMMARMAGFIQDYHHNYKGSSRGGVCVPHRFSFLPLFPTNISPSSLVPQGPVVQR